MVSSWKPSRAKDVGWLWKYVVVHEPRVDREQSHQQNDVSTTEEHVPNLYNQTNNQQTAECIWQKHFAKQLTNSNMMSCSLDSNSLSVPHVCMYLGSHSFAAAPAIPQNICKCNSIRCSCCQLKTDFAIECCYRLTNGISASRIC